MGGPPAPDTSGRVQSPPRAEPLPFDLCGSLPGPGITLLEASAGTGKTFTVTSLVTRLVAEGHCLLSEILAITFTRMATSELRDRVRAHLASAETALASFLDGGARTPPGDRVLALLATGDRAQVRDRHRRLADALATFDEATITTTHGFCHLVLSGLGVTGNLATGAELTEDAADMVEEVIDDLLLRRLLRHGSPPFSREEAADAVRAALGNPDALLDPPPSESRSGLLRRLAEKARAEVSLRLLEANLLTYDDLLVRLEASLADPASKEAACRLLRERYRVVLVDEFQDTDPIQWSILKAAFGSGQTTLVLIGDPKQAIFAFRGADVFAYLEAGRCARHRFTLVENWRSDQALLDACDRVLSPLLLGHPEIPYRTVRASEDHQASGLEGAPVAAALRVRVVFAADHRLPVTPKQQQPSKTAVVDWVARDLARDVVELLDSDARLVRRDPDGRAPPGRALLPGDVAVLVRQNRHALRVQEALLAAGVPAVVSGTDSVFATSSAQQWLVVLEALEQPGDRARAAAAALTPFLGLTAEQLAAAEASTWEELYRRLHLWSDVLRQRGVASLMRAMSLEGGLTPRLLELDVGERELTDLNHVGELLHAEASAHQLGAPALRAWLAGRITRAGKEATDAEERSRRTESDAEAVQVLTVHRAKGLEFPVVYCPYLWEQPAWRGKGKPVLFHDPDDERRHLDLGGGDTSNDHPSPQELSLTEERGEDLRLLYVALTRARHQVVIWWARTGEAPYSPLGRLLTARDQDGSVKTRGKVPKDGEVWDLVTKWAQESAGGISAERCAPLPSTPPRLGGTSSTSRDEARGRLEAARLGRRLDLSWRRTSYSGITAPYHEGMIIGSEPEDPLLTDEPDADGAPPAPAPVTAGPEDQQVQLRSTRCLLADLKGGREVGSFVHRVLEQVDFAAPHLQAELVAAIATEHGRRPVQLRRQPAGPEGMPAPPAGQDTDLEGSPPGPTGMLAAGLAAAIETPLGDLAGGVRLRDLARGDRLDEMGFELPVVGGDDPRAALATADMAHLLSRHLGPGSSLQDYPRRLADPVLASQLRGYLTGSLDLVFRLRRPGQAQRFYVVDYKTNWLGEEGAPLSAWHYRPAALEAEMQRAHYPLQALLYLVALHRYLRWRLPGYDPEANLGGVLYLFLRGMLGPTTPVVGGQPCGVFSWKVPPHLVADLSDLMDRGARGDGHP